MKKFFLVSLALASSMAFAAEVDYSRCTMLAGVQLDHDGKVVPSQFQTIKSQKTDGNKEFIVFESSFGNQKFQTEVTLERDAQGRVVKSTMGGERPSDKNLKQYREGMVNSAVMMAPMATGSFGGYGQQGFMAQEPSYWVKKKKVEGSAQQPVQGFMDPNYEMVSLSKLNAEQAKEAGLEDVEELKRLRQQWKRDKRTANKLRDGYKKVVERSSLVIPMGTESEFEIQDNVCLPKSISSRFYNSQSGQMNTVPVSSREQCDKIKTVYQRHQNKIQECRRNDMQIYSDFVAEMNLQNSYGAWSMGGVGGMVGGMSLAGGMAGGLVGGMGSGMGMGGMYGPMGGMMNGTDGNSLSMLHSMCEFTYNRPAQGTSNQQRPAAGDGSEVQAQ